VNDAPPVVARGLVKRDGHIVAVAGVDLAVEPGDIFGYLGPNGAGKTTSLRMMLGPIGPTAGPTQLFGRDPLLEGARALDGVAGFVEGPRFYPYLSGLRNLRLLADYDDPVSRSLERLPPHPGRLGAVTRAVWDCAVYLAAPLIAGRLVSRRRDVAGQ
jgi:ABC-type multidrug transport system ATPase subunit